ERIDARLRRPRLVLAQELLDAWERQHRRLRRPEVVVHDAVQHRPHARHDAGELQADHAAAEDLGLQTHLVGRAQHADRVRRVRRHEHDVGVGGLDGPDDRRVVDGARRIGLIVDGLEAELLDQLARADQRVLRVLGVGADDRDGLRSWGLCRRQLEEAYGRGGLWYWPWRWGRVGMRCY